jgi:hypothetical protein
MALVDYSSSESDDESSGSDSHHVKRRKGVDGIATHSSRSADGDTRSVSKDADASSMPPLPDTFHDLYASTVRQSVVDDPSLHHGRKRQVPHVVGNWPSHVYIECEFLMSSQLQSTQS